MSIIFKQVAYCVLLGSELMSKQLSLTKRYTFPHPTNKQNNKQHK